MKLTVEQIATAFTGAMPSQTADFNLLGVDGVALQAVHLAISRRGFPALLIPVPHVGSDATRLTHGLAFWAASNVEFIHGTERRQCPAAVVECRDATLLQTFSALVCAVVARLDGGRRPTWASVSSLLLEWESLLGWRQLLTRESERGLRGELWAIAPTSRTPTMVEAWRGPEAERVDFFLGDLGVEVKVGRQARVHMVSQAQVDEPLGDVPVVFMSMHVMIEPMRGLSVPDLVARWQGSSTTLPHSKRRLPRLATPETTKPRATAAPSFWNRPFATDVKTCRASARPILVYPTCATVWNCREIAP